MFKRGKKPQTLFQKPFLQEEHASDFRLNGRTQSAADFTYTMGTFKRPGQGHENPSINRVEANRFGLRPSHTTVHTVFRIRRFNL